MAATIYLLTTMEGYHNTPRIDEDKTPTIVNRQATQHLPDTSAPLCNSHTTSPYQSMSQRLRDLFIGLVPGLLSGAIFKWQLEHPRSHYGGGGSEGFGLLVFVFIYWPIIFGMSFIFFLRNLGKRESLGLGLLVGSLVMLLVLFLPF